MAYIAMAYMVTARVVTAYTAMAYMAMAYIVTPVPRGWNYREKKNLRQGRPPGATFASRTRVPGMHAGRVLVRVSMFWVYCACFMDECIPM